MDKGESMTVACEAQSETSIVAPPSCKDASEQGNALKDPRERNPRMEYPTMTSEHVSSFVTDLVEMAKAMERVPQLEQQLKDSQREWSNAYERTVELESLLEASRRYAASLEQRCHDLEVSRDDAELRFLECDDAKSTLVRTLESLIGDAKGVLAAVTPPEPTPVPTPVVEPRDTYQGVKTEPSPFVSTETQSSGDGQVMASPSADASSSEGTSVGESAPHWTEPVDIVAGQSAADPTAPSSPTPTSPSAPPAEPSATAALPSPGPYTGRYYIDVAGFISRQDWLAGGGSEENYDYRPY